MHRAEANWGGSVRSSSSSGGGGADAFLPQRWAALGPAPLHPHWLPFGAGPKGCMGQALALTVAEGLLAPLLTAVAFSLPPGTSPKDVTAGLTQAPTLRFAGLRLQLRPLAVAPAPKA
jgi:cytochrome P450